MISPCTCGRRHNNQAITIQCMRDQIRMLHQRVSPSDICQCPEYCHYHGRRQYDTLHNAFKELQYKLERLPNTKWRASCQLAAFEEFFNKTSKVFCVEPESEPEVKHIVPWTDEHEYEFYSAFMNHQDALNDGPLSDTEQRILWADFYNEVKKIFNKKEA